METHYQSSRKISPGPILAPVHELSIHAVFLLVLLLSTAVFREGLALSNGACQDIGTRGASERRDMVAALGRMFTRSGAFNGLNYACYGASSASDGWIDANQDLAFWNQHLEGEEIEVVRAAYTQSFERYKAVPCTGNWQRAYMKQLIFTRKIYLNQQEIALRHARALGSCSSD